MIPPSRWGQFMSSEESLLELSEDSHEPELHADERWLISYADMMTLLFGLFVLLYAMVDQFEVIQKSADKQFVGDKAKPTASTGLKKQAPRENKLKSLQMERELLLSKVKILEETLKAKESELADLRN